MSRTRRRVEGLMPSAPRCVRRDRGGFALVTREAGECGWHVLESGFRTRNEAVAEAKEQGLREWKVERS